MATTRIERRCLLFRPRFSYNDKESGIGGRDNEKAQGFVAEASNLRREPTKVTDAQMAIAENKRLIQAA